MGWLGWTEDQALAADVNAILVAHRGKMDMLAMCFGGGGDSTPASKAKPAAKPPPFTPKVFRAMFADKPLEGAEPGQKPQDQHG